jgi:hypothetical protein
MRIPYCCEASRELFEQYYARQQRGDGVYLFHIGILFQKRHGLGATLGPFFRRILPVVKNLAPSTLRTTADFIEDVAVRGKSWKDAAFKRISQTLSKLAFSRNSHSGSGLRRKMTVLNAVLSVAGETYFLKMAFVHQDSCECTKS